MSKKIVLPYKGPHTDGIHSADLPNLLLRKFFPIFLIFLFLRFIRRADGILPAVGALFWLLRPAE